MTTFIQKLRQAEEAFDLSAARFVAKHPMLGLVMIFIGMPLFVLVAVGLSTIILMSPVAWLLGWL